MTVIQIEPDTWDISEYSAGPPLSSRNSSPNRSAQAPETNHSMAHDSDSSVHKLPCPTDENAENDLCWGRLEGGERCKKLSMFVSPDDQPEFQLLPRCILHRNQQLLARKCIAAYQGGAECNAWFQLEPQGVYLCTKHKNLALPCYLLRIPAELRDRIYSFLLPDKVVPARFSKSSCLRSDSEPCYPQILRLNHKIYEEATKVLYAHTAYEIEVSRGYGYICNTRFEFRSFPEANRCHRRLLSTLEPYPGEGSNNHNSGNHALLDYQRQLRILEQQNKRRLLMSRLETEHYTGLPPIQHGPSSRPSRLDDLLVSDRHRFMPPLETPIWHPWCFSHSNFNMIRSFHVKIVFAIPLPPPLSPSMMQPNMNQPPSPQQQQQQPQFSTQLQVQAQNGQLQHVNPPPIFMPMQTTHPPIYLNHGPSPPLFLRAPAPLNHIGAPTTRETWRDSLVEMTQYETCDTLHRIIERFQMLPLPIYRLNVSIIINQYDKPKAALKTAQLFLRTFKDLRDVVQPNVDSVIWVNDSWDQIDLLAALDTPFASPIEVSESSRDGYDDRDEALADFVKRWKAGISREGPPPDILPVVTAYWILHNTCLELQCLQAHERMAVYDVEIYDSLLAAKKARENEDLAAMRAASQKIQAVWNSYKEKQRMFEQKIESKVQFAEGLLGVDDTGSSGKGKGRVVNPGSDGSSLFRKEQEELTALMDREQ